MHVRRAKGSASVPRLPFPAEKHIHLSCYCLQLTKSSGWFLLQEGSVSESPGRTLMCKVSLCLGEDFLVWPPVPSLLVHISAPFAHCCPYVCLCRCLHLRCFGNLWFSFLSLFVIWSLYALTYALLRGSNVLAAFWLPTQSLSLGLFYSRVYPVLRFQFCLRA